MKSTFVHELIGRLAPVVLSSSACTATFVRSVPQSDFISFNFTRDVEKTVRHRFSRIKNLKFLKRMISTYSPTIALAGALVCRS